MIEVQRETTCECRACRAIPDLDLKFVAHFGEYALQTVAGKQKPTGSDVTLAHRLLKNSVTAKTSWAAYALFTRAVFEPIGATPEGLHTADEAYKHLGQVSTLAVDLNSRIAAIEESAHVSIDPAEAHLAGSFELPVPPAEVWTWLNDPHQKGKWQPDNRWSNGRRLAGRTGVGAENHCAHASGTALETILAWHPYEYFTCETRQGPLRMRATFSLTAIPSGTRLQYQHRMMLPLPEWILRPLARFLIRRAAKLPEMLANLERLIAEPA